MSTETVTEDKVENTPAGGALIGKREGQTIIHNDGTLGGYLVGKLHKNGGIKAVNKSSGQNLEMQGSEVVITAPAVADQTKREFEGNMMTNREILSKINQDGGGVSFADGGEVPEKWIPKGKQYNYGGKTVSDHDILKEISQCGCEHNSSSVEPIAGNSTPTLENGGSFSHKSKRLRAFYKTNNPSIDLVLQKCQPLIESLIEKEKVRFFKENEREMSAFALEMYEIELLYKMVQSLNHYLKQTDKITEFKLGNIGGTFEIYCIVERDGGTYDFNTEFIPAGGYNIQQFHYRYITKTNLPVSHENTATENLKAKIGTIKKIETIEKDIERLKSNSKSMQDKIDTGVEMLNKTEYPLSENTVIRYKNWIKQNEKEISKLNAKKENLNSVFDALEAKKTGVNFGKIVKEAIGRKILDRLHASKYQETGDSLSFKTETHSITEKADGGTSKIIASVNRVKIVDLGDDKCSLELGYEMRGKYTTVAKYDTIAIKDIPYKINETFQDKFVRFLKNGGDLTDNQYNSGFVSDNQDKLKDIIDKYTDNSKYSAIMYREEKGNWFFAKNSIYFWLYDEPQVVDKLNSDVYDYVMYPKTSMQQAFQKGYVPPIKQIWTKKYQNKTRGSQHLLGVVEAYYDELKANLYINMMSVNPKHLRQGINSFMVNQIRTELGLEKSDVIFVDVTDQGKAFEKSGKFEHGGGLSKGKSIEDIANMHNVSVDHIKSELAKGIKVEAEHTSNPQEQETIAKDHLVENPNYYTILIKAGLSHGGMTEYDSNPFLNYYFEVISDFLAMQDIQLNQDWTFSHKGEKFTVEPLLSVTKNDETDTQVDDSNYELESAIFVIYDYEQNDVAQIDFTAQADGKKHFTAQSELFEWQNKKFAKGGKINDSKEDLAKDAKDGNTPARDLNNYNDVVDVQEDGIVGNHQDFADSDTSAPITGTQDASPTTLPDASMSGTMSFKKGGELQTVGDTEIADEPKSVDPLGNSVNNWNNVPSAWKNTIKVKKVTWTNNPFDKGLQDIFKPFTGLKDDRRPLFKGMNFDENGITATDAYKLLTLPYPNKKFEGVYKADLTLKTDEGQLTIEGKYPKYSSVIPRSKDLTSINIDVYKLYQYANVALKYADENKHVANFKTLHGNISIDCKMLVEDLKTILKLGHQTIYALYGESKNRAIVFSTSSNYELGQDDIVLQMPSMIPDDYDNMFGTINFEGERQLKCYFDFTDGEIHNADGSIADFKMTYEDNVLIDKEYTRLLKKVNGKKNTLSILDYVQVKQGMMRATDLETDITIKNVKLRDGLYFIKDNVPEITMEPIEDYPDAMQSRNGQKYMFDDTAIQFSIPCEVLEFYISKLKITTSKDDLRPLLQGICIHHTSDNELFLVSTDANIMLIINITPYVVMPMYNRDIKCVMPTKHILDYLKVLAPEQSLSVKCNKQLTEITSPEVDYITINIDGNYPNYQGVIPYSTDKLVKVNLTELKQCIQSPFVKEYDAQRTSTGRESTFIFNTANKISIGHYDGDYRNPRIVNESIKELCKAEIINDNDAYFNTNNKSMCLIMPVINTQDLDVSDFAFNKITFNKLLDVCYGNMLELHYTNTTHAYMVEMADYSFTKTKMEHKTIEQKPPAVKIQAEEKIKDVDDIKQAVESLKVLEELTEDPIEKEDIHDAIEVLNLLLETQEYSFGGSFQFGDTTINTPLDVLN